MFFQVLKIVGSCTFAVIYMMLVFLGKGIHLTWQVTSRKTPGGQVLRLDNFRGTSRFQMNLKLSISSFKVWKTRFFFPIFRDENKKTRFWSTSETQEQLRNRIYRRCPWCSVENHGKPRTLAFCWLRIASLCHLVSIEAAGDSSNYHAF